MRPHGFLVLRDLTVDAIILDGVELPDPKGVSDTRDGGGFCGYFNVPVGTHTVVGRIKDKSHTMTLVVRPGAATVKRFDMDAGWHDDEPETAAQYRRLAASGSMTEALRPWPLGSVYFRGVAEGLKLDSRLVGSGLLPFSGVANVPPGTHAIEIGEHHIELPVMAESHTLVVLDGTNRPTLVTGTRTLMAMSRDLNVMPFDSFVSYASLGTSGTRVFDDSDLEWLEDAFAKATTDETEQYVAALRWHYVLDSEMANQATYFARFGDRLVEHLKKRPSLLATGAKLYLGYFAQDLVDAGHEDTVAAGKRLAAAIEKAELAPAADADMPPRKPSGPVQPFDRKRAIALLVTAVIFAIAAIAILARR